MNNENKKSVKSKKNMKGSKNVKGQIVEKYRDEYPALIKEFVIEEGMVNRRGQIKWSKFAKIFQVSRQTIKRWRDKQSEYYKPQFAEAVKEAESAAEAGTIKRNLITRAKGYVSHKTIRKVEETKDGTFTTVIKQRVIEPCDVSAAKLVLANYGPPSERWYDKQKVGNVEGEKLEISISVNEIKPGDVIKPASEKGI